MVKKDRNNTYFLQVNEIEKIGTAQDISKLVYLNKKKIQTLMFFSKESTKAK